MVKKLVVEPAVVQEVVVPAVVDQLLQEGEEWQWKNLEEHQEEIEEHSASLKQW